MFKSSLSDLMMYGWVLRNSSVSLDTEYNTSTSMVVVEMVAMRDACDVRVVFLVNPFMTWVLRTCEIAFKQAVRFSSDSTFS